jgi:O-antigen ligase
MQANRLEFARASFYNVGLFAVAAATIIPLGVAAFAARRSLQLPLWATATIVVSFGLGLAGLFLSFSKSAWLAAAFAIVLVMLLIIKTWRRRIALVFASAVISSILIPWPALFLQVAPAVNAEYRTVMVSLVGEARFDSWNPETLAGRGSLTERFYAVDAGVRMALVNPIFGVGLDQFGPNYWNPAYRPAAAKDALDHAHSFFPEIAAELGLIAAVFAFVIYAAALWAMLRIYRRTNDQLTRILAAGLAAAIVAWLVVATAFGCFIYRPTLDLSSDVVASVVIVAAAIALARLVDAEKRLPFAEATRSLYG